MARAGKFSYVSHLCFEKKILSGAEPELFTKLCPAQPLGCIYAYPAGRPFPVKRKKGLYSVHIHTSFSHAILHFLDIL